MPNLIVTGCGTGVGKTVVSAILAELYSAHYWKPIECGESDSKRVEKLLGPERIHPPAYSLKKPCSPHKAARLEKISIVKEKFCLPKAKRPLVIEGAGGVLVPLSSSMLLLDLFKQWDFEWVVVSKHYLGSINHTLLTLAVLKQHQVRVKGIIFNGKPNKDSESAILLNSALPLLGRILPEKVIDSATVQKYVEQWQHLL